MEREYLNGVKNALENGMSPEEVQQLFNKLYNNSNTKRGRQALRFFCKGINYAQKKSLSNQSSSSKGVQYQ